MDMLNIQIVRRWQFYGCLMPIAITVAGREGNAVCRRRITSFKPVTLQLPKQDYIITFSNKIPFSRTISAAVSVNGAAADEARIDLEIAHINALSMFVPLLWLLTPAFDYRTTLSYQGLSPIAKPEKRDRISPLSLPFLLLFLFFLFLTISMWIQQFAFSSPPEIEVWALEGTDAYTKYTYELLGGIMGYIAILPLFILLTVLSFLLFRKVNRWRQRGRKRSADENAPAILYLRSFEDDRITAKEVNAILRPGVSEEEALVSVLDDIAPVLSVGRPNEKYLPDGAACIVITDAEWHEKVAALARKAKLVVLRPGSTEGVLWELKYCLENLDWKKLLLVLPKDRTPSDLREIKSILTQYGIDADSLFARKKKKTKGSILNFLYFDDMGQPVCVPLQMSRIESWFTPLEDKIKEALGAVSARFGIKTKKRRPWIWITLFCAFNILATATAAVGSYLTFKTIEHGRFPHDLITAGQEIQEVAETIDGLTSKTQADFLFFVSLTGLLLQDDDSITAFYTWETELMNKINSREYELLTESASGYPTRYLTLAKKYCTDAEYDAFIAYLQQCIALGWAKGDALPQTDAFDEETQEILLSKLESLPLYRKQNPTREEQLALERQFRAVVLDMQADGYDMAPLMRAGFAQTGLEIYQAATGE